MPPIVANAIYMSATVWLCWRELKISRGVTNALWIPIFWLFIIGSRTTSQWLQIAGVNFGGGIVEEEGSPFDAAVYSVLIFAGLWVLRQRGIRLQTFARRNIWLTGFIVYCLLSCLWSDFPFVSFKRWIKILGHPIMMLILLTEPEPEEAMIRVLKLCGYFFIIVSILFIKYYPQWGRGFDEWNGSAADTGITINKNTLGCACLVYVYFFFWYFLQVRQWKRSPRRRTELIICAIMIGLGLWLLNQAHSATSSVSMVIGISTVLLLGRPFIDRRNVGLQVIGGVALVVIFTLVTGINLYQDTLSFLGKDSTLTDRTKVWTAVLAEKNNPIIGTGFEAFWLGDRRERLWTTFWWQPRQAHNGYLETYINLGLLGLALMVILIVTTYFKGKKELFRNFDMGRFQLGFLAAFVFYNWTEAAFKALHIVWFIFYLIAVDYPKRAPVSVLVENSSEPEDLDTGVHLKNA